MRGSLAPSEIYKPSPMNLVSLQSDTLIPKTDKKSLLLSDVAGLKTYDRRVEEAGYPCICCNLSYSLRRTRERKPFIEVGINGGNLHPDGVRLRGWAVVTA